MPWKLHLRVVGLVLGGGGCRVVWGVHTLTCYMPSMTR